jgi:hypothetical protein
MGISEFTSETQNSLLTGSREWIYWKASLIAFELNNCECIFKNQWGKTKKAIFGKCSKLGQDSEAFYIHIKLKAHGLNCSKTSKIILDMGQQLLAYPFTKSHAWWIDYKWAYVHSLPY